MNQHPLPADPPFADMLWIPGGSFRMGSDHHYPEERLAHGMAVDASGNDHVPVTNAQFRRFVRTTGSVTVAEPRIAPYLPGFRIRHTVIKGGSHHCAPNYSRRYRPSPRHPEAIDTSTCHLVFRSIEGVRRRGLVVK